MGDTASLGLSMARTSEACAAVVILVWRCQFTVVSACLGTPGRNMQGWQARSEVQLEHWWLYQDV